ncbi:hypothetical protein PV04_05708 [Phialophora macrospora]|uniref:aldehyde dehydrogenase (NAD(+)) n=1 Tax=Phialophora macrospora TaxID=1851006 RepID=A0A0D2DW75_9EURO|nr:hypothetical protein PV04_05708 [Phialophora macrospora]
MTDLKVLLTAPNGKTITLPTGLFIDNEFVKAAGGQTITSINPSDESEIATVEAASAADVDKAVAAARAGFNDPSWRDLSGTDRGILLYRLADLIEQNREILATLETWDNGKPYSVAYNDDLVEGISTFRYYAGWSDKIQGSTIPTTPQKFAYTLKLPVGVCAQIIPWNYPLAMAAWKFGPALATGNVAGVPKGVVNILNGWGREAGVALASHPGINKIAFTGSTITGKQIIKNASVSMKAITLEIGGKSPLLVYDDADLEQAAKWAHIGIMGNMAQICTATSRILVQQSVYDQFTKSFQQVITSTSVVGDPFDHATFQGPQITKVQYDKILGYVETGKSEGATLSLGGGGKGFFIEPTVFTAVKPEMKIFRDEIFGPFAVVVPFQDEEEAISLANDTDYGLGAAVFTTNIERGHRVAAKIEAGMVWINSSQDSDFRVPFGGVKQSGIGRELGAAGLHGYLQEKAVHGESSNLVPSNMSITITVVNLGTRL